MKDAMDKVKEFHLDGNVPVRNWLRHIDNKIRIKLLVDEVVEYLEAEERCNLIEIAKELADIIYVACGTALFYGIPLAEVFDKVHESNMTKLKDGVEFSGDGKILKSESYVSPIIDIKHILEEYVPGCL